MPSNIIFPIYKKASCFEACLKSVQIYSPKSHIHVISGDSDMQLGELTPIIASRARLSDYGRAAETFRSVYEHRSPNEFEFELFNFQRWFYAHEYATRNAINEFWMFDHDVLLFTDLDVERKPYVMTSPVHMFYCRDLNMLGSWLDGLLEAFSSKNETYSRWIMSNAIVNHGLSDMVVAWLSSPYVDITSKIDNDAYWDNNLTCAHGFKMEESSAASYPAKLVDWVDGFPYFYHLTEGRVRCKALHCWGPVKPHMEHYLGQGLASRTTWS